MKIDLTDNEKKQLDRAIANNPLAKYLKAKQNMNFSVGDVLIKKIRSWGDKAVFNVETVSYTNKSPQRYVYVAEDSFGIGYIKQLTVNGKLGKEIYSLTDFHYDDVYFEVDPAYAETIFLGGEFDVKTLNNQANEGRKLVAKVNRSIGKKMISMSEINDFFSQLKVGDTFYTAHNYAADNFYEYQVISTETMTMKEFYEEHRWEHDNLISKHGFNCLNGISIFYKLTLQTSSYNRKRPHLSSEFINEIVFKQKPAQVDK